MSFSLELPEDVADIRDWAHEFARDVMRPAGHEWDKRQEFPYPIVKEAAKIGLYGIEPLLKVNERDENGEFVEKSGLFMPVMVEELSWGDPGLMMAIIGSALPAAAIGANGDMMQVLEWVPQCYGDANNVQLGALCVSEPDAGSDVSSMRTRAVYDEATDEWVINGTKAWITNGGIANIHVVVACVDPALKSRGQASFIVPPGTKGLSMGQKYDKMGIRASHTAEVVLDNVRVPGRCLLMKGGKEKLDEKLARAREALAGVKVSSGKQPAMATFEATRPLVGAMAVGIGRAALEYSVQYAKERSTFGKQIANHQMIASKIAKMATEVDAARLLVHRAAWMARNGGFKNGEGSMSKWKASEVAVRATEEAIQILGGSGYVTDHPVERWHRDSKIMTIFEGTSEIQQLVIASAVTGLTIR